MDFDLVSTVRDVRMYNYLHYLSITFLYFDHADTFPEEVSRIWTRPRSFSSIAFFLNRYISFVVNIVNLVMNDVNLSEKSCRHFNTFRQALLIAVQCFVGILLMLRTFALWGRSRRVLLFMLGVTLPLVAIAAWSAASVVPHLLVETISGCHVVTTQDVGYRIAAAWEALFAFDLMIFVLTLLKTRQERHTLSVPKTWFGRLPLMMIMVRDGAIYFACMGLANLTNVLTYYFAPPILKGGLSTFASAVSVTMMSRLILNLHSHANGGIMSDAPEPPSWNSPSTSTSGSQTKVDFAFKSEQSTFANTPGLRSITVLDNYPAPAFEMQSYDQRVIDIGHPPKAATSYAI